MMRRLSLLLFAALGAGAILELADGCSSFVGEEGDADAGTESGAVAEGSVDDGAATDGGMDGARSLTPVFGRGFGTSAGDGGTVITPAGMVVDVTGGTSLAGSYSGAGIDLDGGSLPDSHALDVFLLRLDGNGNYLASTSFDAPGDQSARALRGAEGALYAAIATDSAFTLSGAETVPSSANAGYMNSAVVLFTGDAFSPSGLSSFTGNYDEFVTKTASAAGGVVFSLGDWTHALSFDFQSSSTRGSETTGVFLARSVLPTGAANIRSDYCPPGSQCVSSALATNTAAESTFAGGAFQGSVGTPLDDGGGVGVTNTTLDLDAFVMKVDSTLAIQWVRSFGGSGAQQVRAIGVIPGSDDIIIAGGFDGTLVLPDNSVTPTRGLEDIFVMRLDTNGGVVWAKTFGGAGGDRVRAVAVDAQGSVFLTGQFASPVLDFGGAPLTNADGTGRGTSDVFVAWLDSAGNYVSSASYGDDADEDAVDIGLDGKGNVSIAGSFGGSLAFGATTLHAQGKVDTFVAKLAR